MTSLTGSWQFWAFLAAMFAALTAITAKIGVAGINSNMATLIRTIVVVGAIVLLIRVNGDDTSLSGVSGRTWLFLVLSGLATGASWLCYFRALQIGKAAQVAPVDKLSVVFVAVLAALFLGETMSLTAWGGVGLIGIGAVLVAIG